MKGGDVIILHIVGRNVELAVTAVARGANSSPAYGATLGEALGRAAADGVDVFHVNLDDEPVAVKSFRTPEPEPSVEGAERPRRRAKRSSGGSGR